MAKYTATQIRKWDCDTGLPDGRYIPARPLDWGGIYGLRQRIKHAWGVLIGKYDALDWE